MVRNDARFQPGVRSAEYRQNGSIGHNGNRADFDEILRRGHLRDFDHRRCRQWRLEILPAHFVYGIEMLHVANIDIDAADIGQSAARKPPPLT